jgi:hypothetical protein
MASHEPPRPDYPALRSLLLEAIAEPLGLLLRTNSQARALAALRYLRQQDPSLRAVQARVCPLGLVISRVQAEVTQSGRPLGGRKLLSADPIPEELQT